MKSIVADVSSTVGRGRGRLLLTLFAAFFALAVSGCAGGPASQDRMALLAGDLESQDQPVPLAGGSTNQGSQAAFAGDAKPSQSTFRDCPQCPEMVMIPAGSFLIGSPESEEGRGADEGQREVTVVDSFAIGVYEVTFEEWDACVDDGGCDGYRPEDYGWGRGRRPVTGVSWRDARAYTEWLSDKTGHPYGLPSEARWEYAARAGTRTARYWGESAAEQCRYANGADQDLAETNASGLARFDEYGLTIPSCSDGQGDGTAPVGSYEPNAFGLYDMIGNLTEWTDDCWNPDHSGRPDGDGIRFSGDCSRRMLRGGTWGYPSEFLRSAYRFQFELDHRDNGLGFRVIRVIR